MIIHNFLQLLNSQPKTQPIVPQQSVPEPIHATTFNHVGSLGQTQHSHQAQMQHENLMKVLQIQQVMEFLLKSEIICILECNTFNYIFVFPLK